MPKQAITIMLLIWSMALSAQTNYSDLNNWAFHPDKSSSIISTFNLDIAVIDKDLQIDSVIQVPKNAFTNTGVDVFFVHPTILSGTTAQADTIPIDQQNKPLISASILAQGGLLSKYGRLFAPHYTQCTGLTYYAITSKSVQAEMVLRSYADIKVAFMHYLQNYNNGNKIIIAGHSQGSYLLGYLLADLFDNDPTLKDKLVVAALGGMNYVYTQAPTNKGGWWNNIPLCTEISECGCIQNWTSFKEGQSFPNPNYGLPLFNQTLADSGLFRNTIDTTQHLCLQDSLVYDTQASPLRYYIAPNAQYQLGGSAGFIAFDSLYNIRFRRESATKLGLNIEHTPLPNDQRPNDLLALESDPSFANLGYHNKDYHIYLWALMQQIDAKLNCSSVSSIVTKDSDTELTLFPNPANNKLNLQLKLNGQSITTGKVNIYNLSGQIVLTTNWHNASVDVSSLQAGIYWLHLAGQYSKFVKSE